MIVVDICLAMLTGIVAIPVWVFFGECVLALLPTRRTRATPPKPPRFAVLVPAHNEEAVIGETLRSLMPELSDGDRLIVVADNCSDGTARVVREAGATAIERADAERRGKGYALVFGVEHLSEDPPDVVIVVDADCRVSEGSLRILAEQAAATNRPVQAEYLLEAPEKPTPLSVVSALAFLVRNRVRPRGMHRLGLPCHLTGSGMAFPYQVLRSAPPTGSYLVEDLLMGIELAIMGHAPLLCPEAFVTSDLPDRDKAAEGQRRRWEHGQLLTLLKKGPRLILLGLTRFRIDLLALGLDLIVPPLALLVMMLLALLGLSGAAVLLGASPLAASSVAGSLFLVATGVMLSWVRYGRHTLPFRYLVVIPFYVLWKIPLYLAFFLRRRQKTWERTERSAEKTGD